MTSYQESGEARVDNGGADSGTVWNSVKFRYLAACTPREKMYLFILKNLEGEIVQLSDFGIFLFIRHLTTGRY